MIVQRRKLMMPRNPEEALALRRLLEGEGCTQERLRSVRYMLSDDRIEVVWEVEAPC